MQKNSWLLIIFLIVVISAVILAWGTPSNRWVCERGEWVKRGAPNSPPPSKECFDEYSIEKELSSLSQLLENGISANEEGEEGLSESINLDKIDSEKTPNPIQLIYPQVDEVIRSPYQISGFASGTWYFEASFPVVLRASDGKILSETYAQAQTDWMTEDFVPFEAELVFDSGDYLEGELIIIKSNPSGLAEHDAQVIYPVRFIPKTYEN